jgi:hypothetical protein
MLGRASYPSRTSRTSRTGIAELASSRSVPTFCSAAGKGGQHVDSGGRRQRQIRGHRLAVDQKRRNCHDRGHGRSRGQLAAQRAQRGRLGELLGVTGGAAGTRPETDGRGDAQLPSDMPGFCGGASPAAEVSPGDSAAAADPPSPGADASGGGDPVLVAAASIVPLPP